MAVGENGARRHDCHCHRRWSLVSRPPPPPHSRSSLHPTIGTTQQRSCDTFATAAMGAKHSVPVTSTQNEGPSMPYSSFAMATARSDNSDTASSAQASEQQQHHHSSSYRKLSLNTATIRPHESAAGGSSHAQKHSAHSETSAAAEAACMTPLDTKCDVALLCSLHSVVLLLLTHICGYLLLLSGSQTL